MSEQQVGSLAEETARLMDALGWARGEDGQAHDAHREGASSCDYCPLCLVIDRVRATHPETLQHLNSAAQSLMLAATTYLESRQTAHRNDSAEPSATGVRRVDLDG